MVARTAALLLLLAADALSKVPHRPPVRMGRSVVVGKTIGKRAAARARGKLRAAALRPGAACNAALAPAAVVDITRQNVAVISYANGTSVEVG